MLKKIKAVLSFEHGFFARDFRIKKDGGSFDSPVQAVRIARKLTSLLFFALVI